MQELLSPLVTLLAATIILFGCIISRNSKSEDSVEQEESWLSEVFTEEVEDGGSQRNGTSLLLERIDELTDRISDTASFETEKWNERAAERDLEALLKRIYSIADRIRHQTPDVELPETPDALDMALETVRVRMLQAREDIRRRTEGEREYYQRVTLLNQAVLQVKSGMKTGEEGREIVREALENLKAREVQPCFSRQLLRRAERAKREAHNILHSA